MGEIQRYQEETHPFYFVIRSLCNPFAFGQSSVLLEVESSFIPRYSIEIDEIWDYRTKLVIFVNGLVSSSNSLKDRIKVRKLMETCGFNSILKVIVILNKEIRNTKSHKKLFESRTFIFGG
jgi:hypothetical protein